MLLSDYERYTYARSPLVETICQLRFPTILSIGAKEPAEFQEAVRRDFPRYAVREERLPPRVLNPGTPQQPLEQPQAIRNFHFVSEDGLWKLNLTRDFISLSTLRYTRWEEFAHRLDKPLAQFIQIYQPAPFTRVGLRYVNAFSRKRLGLEDHPWNDLLEPPFLGPLDEEDIQEAATTKCSVDLETGLADGVRMKLHAGPGFLGDGKKDPEPKFILDGDFSVYGGVAADKVPEKLEAMHRYAVRLFLGSMTNLTFTALGPVSAD